jgi:hypothetical protein
MGNDAEFLRGGRRGDNSEYVTVGSAKIVNGIKGKIVKRRGDSDTHSNLPKYAATSDMYFRQNKKGVCQARVYLAHKMCLDFDWSHHHNNEGDGRSFKLGTVHVQVWQWHSDGSFTRLNNNARYMNNSEIKKYGDLIRAFCKSVKFR